MANNIKKYSHNQINHSHEDLHQTVIPFKGNMELEIEGKQGVVSGHTIGIAPLGAACFLISGSALLASLDMFTKE